MKRKDKYFDITQEIHKYYVIAGSAEAAVNLVKNNSATDIFVDHKQALKVKQSRLSLLPEYVFEVVESYTAEEVVDTSIQYDSIP